MSNRKDRRAQLAREMRLRQETARRRRRRLVTSSLVAALLLVAGMIGFAAYAAQQPGNVKAPTAASAQPTGLTVGHGPVTVDLYVDLMCPICKAYEQQAGPVLDNYVKEGRITLVYHPLNILDDNSTTQYSTRAGAAVAAAADQGKLVQYLEALYKAQPPEQSAGLTDAQLIEIGRSVGITSDQFANAVNSGKYRDWITYVTSKADERGVQGTPTVFVDGHQIDNTVTALETAVDAG
jgi:protein-disulfide isomerase